jgi:hypothetical protein
MIEGMIVDKAAYIVSNLQVFAACAFVELLFPLFMWRKYLKGKSYGYRFAFCLITQNVFLINLVLLLGFLKICNVYTVLAGMALLYLIVSRQYAKKSKSHRFADLKRTITRLRNGTQKPKAALRDLGRLLGNQFRRVLRWELWGHIRRHFVEYLFLAAAVGYNAVFLTHNMNLYHSVQFSDIPVHQSWIYELAHNGVLFSDGIYPFGMHAMIYVVHTLFFLDLREVMLYFGAFQTLLLLVSVYLLARKIFRWKFSALIALLFFSLFLNQGRYVASLPQETGMFAVTLCAYFLIEFFRTPLKKHTIERDSRVRRFFRINQYMSRRYVTADALLFMLSVSLCIAYHFYTAIAACLFMIAILLTHLVKAVRKQYWVPVAVSGMLGVLIAVAPFAACYATGTPFQESMNWAMTVIAGETYQGDNYQANLESSINGDSAAQTVTATDTAAADETAADVSPLAGLNVKDKLLFIYHAIYDYVSVTLLGDFMTRILLLCFAAGIFLSLVSLPFKSLRPFGSDYAAMMVYTVMICIVGAAQTLHMQELIAASRAGTFIDPYLGIVYAIGADFLFGLLALLFTRGMRPLLSGVYVAGCVLLLFTAVRLDMQHDYFEVNLAYYNEPVYLIRHIRQDYPHNSFTVISTTDERYQVMDYGYHENLSKFMNMVNGKEPEYKIPTPYVFVFIEKTVLQDYYYGRVDVSPVYANKEFVYMADNQDYYFQRAVLESMAYYWAQRFMELYPNTMRVYYEDDIYICYLIEQNPYYLYDFQVDYLPVEEKTV